MTPWTEAQKASLSITYSWSLLKLMSIESVMPSNHLILCHPLPSHLPSFQASGPFQMSQFFTSGGQSIGVSASASVLLMNIQDWFPLGWTGWIPLQSEGLSRVFSNTTVQKHQFFGAQPFSQCISTYINIVLYDKNNVDVMCVTNTRHQQWKDNVKKKFTFTYICINSNSHIEEAAAALWLFYADSCHW